MFRTVGLHHRADLLLEIVILFTQPRHCFGIEDRGAVRRAAVHRRLHLGVAGLCLDQALLGFQNLRVQFRRLLVAHQLARRGRLQAVAAAEFLHAALGVGDVLAQFVEPPL